MAHAGNIDSPGTFSRLRSLPPHDVHIAERNSEAFQEEFSRIGRSHRSLGGALSQATIVMLASTEAELGDAIRKILKTQVLPTLTKATVHLIYIDQKLGYRYAIPRVLLQTGEDPDALRARSSEFPPFESSRHLLGDTTYGLSSYLAPLFLCASPRVWGFPVPRAGGVIVVSFGAFLAGTEGSPVEPLQLFHPRPEQPSTTNVDVSYQDLNNTLNWWIQQLNKLFYQLTDPCNFSSSGGDFLPNRQLETFLTAEQLFRNVQSISALHRDGHARRSLFFDTLDTLEGLRLLSFDQMCNYSEAEAVYDDLLSTLPDSVGRTLLPRARRGLSALRDLQSGFFPGIRVSEAEVRLPDSNGRDRAVSKGRAVALWLRVLRNAGHSFISRQRTRERDETLLAIHNGKMNDQLSDLAYMYLLRLMTYPHLLKGGPYSS